MAILTLEEIKSGLDEIDLEVVSKCKFCNSKPEWLNNDQIFVIRCSGCKTVANGFMCRPCQKSQDDLSKSITKLLNSWKLKNVTTSNSST